MRRRWLVLGGTGWVSSVMMANAAFGGAPPKETAELIAKGKALFVSATCETCHGPGGDVSKSPTGMAIKARNLATEPFKAGDTAANIFHTITEGLKDPKTGAPTAMVGFKNLSDDDRWAVAYYVKSLRPAAAKKK